jgi:3-oxoacyl-[acyl-carrier protein] reductase
MIFKDKVAVVTGGSRGIGRTIALGLAKGGASVAICSNVPEGMEETAAEIRAFGVKALTSLTDVSKAGDVESFAAKVMETLGKVDILVNNAGITRDNLMLRMSEQDWDLVLSINLKSAFLVTKEFVKPMMKARSGRIVNIASIVGVRGNAGQANYSASKAGLIGLTKTIAREFASRNINCNAVAPGYIQTLMTQALNEKAKETLLKEIPLGRLGETEDVAQAVLFLASEAAAYITGQVICVDGGMVI